MILIFCNNAIHYQMCHMCIRCVIHMYILHVWHLGVLKQNNLSLVICVAISLSLWWQKDHLSLQGKSDPSATANEVILPYRSPDESCFVFISYCLMILCHFQLRYMRKICIYYCIYLLKSKCRNTPNCNIILCYLCGVIITSDV